MRAASLGTRPATPKDAINPPGKDDGPLNGVANTNRFLPPRPRTRWFRGEDPLSAATGTAGAGAHLECVHQGQRDQPEANPGPDDPAECGHANPLLSCFLVSPYRPVNLGNRAMGRIALAPTCRDFGTIDGFGIAVLGDGAHPPTAKRHRPLKRLDGEEGSPSSRITDRLPIWHPRRREDNEDIKESGREKR